MKTQLIHHIQEYHEASKHSPERYADHLPFLDWDHQPSPYRHWKGGKWAELSFAQVSQGNLYGAAPQAMPLDLENLGGMLHLAFGLSAKKQYQETQWELRMNPSSGNLHPTEVNLILPQGELTGLWHYQPLHHTLEERAPLTPTQAALLAKGGFTTGIVVGLSSILIRESWKYGVRAFRYCQLDVGHALACLKAAAGLYGWGVWVLEMPYSVQKRLLGYEGVKFPKSEEEEPELLCWVGPATPQVELQLLEQFPHWHNLALPQPLASEHLPWQPNEEVAQLSRSRDWGKPIALAPQAEIQPQGPGPAIIQRRRSGQAYDSQASLLDLSQLEALLAPWSQQNHTSEFLEPLPTFFMLHRVDGVPPGLYLFGHNEAQLSQMRQTLAARFLFEKIPGSAPLYLLEPGNAQALAQQASCNQKIAAQSALSCFFLAPMAAAVQTPQLYRKHYWQAGFHAQALYWEATRLGLAGTGIGCFHDDQIHDYLGLQGSAFQDVYHFTLGKALNDPRLTDLPPYDAKRNYSEQE